jgi:membrane fusion protein (multidrug efflux system)
VPSRREIEHETESPSREEPNHAASPPEEAVRVRPRSRMKGYALLGLLVLAGAAFYFWWQGRSRESTDDAQVDGHLAPISAKISGSVLEVLVDVNYQVKAGQVLVRLDPRDYQARVDQLRAALASAEAQASAAHANVPVVRGTTTTTTAGAAAQLATAQADLQRALVAANQAETSGVAAAQANVNQAEANNRKAQSDLARMRPLIAKQEISQQQFDAYAAAADVTAAQLRAAQEQLTGARQMAQNAREAAHAAEGRVRQAQAGLQESRANEQQVNVTEAQAHAATSSIQQARANLAAAELDLSYTTIVAPMDGEVTNKSVEPGQIVQPGQGLMTIVPLRDVWVTANFKETQLARVRPGQRAEIKVDMYGQTISGRVDSIAGATGARTSLLPPENATGNFVKVVQRIPVKIVFDSLPEGVVLRPGMNVDATIITR